jgi:hypothetical protein
MENSFLLYHHLGFGDHIAHNGMVRKMYEEKSFDTFNIFVKYHNYNNVAFMFRDLEKLNLIKVKDDNEAKQIYNNFKGKKLNNILTPTESKRYFDESGDNIFYEKMGYKPSLMKDYFYIKRDFDEEEKVFKELTNGVNKYIFLHEDTQRGYGINKERINCDLPIIKTDIKYPFFSLMKVIEKAENCYVICSAFLELLITSQINKNVFVDISRYPTFGGYIESKNLKVLK